MFWPTPQDYNEAVQQPQQNFSDADLRASQPELNSLGLPKPITGAFASVYRLRSRNRDWAVKCFLSNQYGQNLRYEQISEHLRRASMPYSVDFEYINRGISVRGEWFPILKMEWIEGQQLSDFVTQNVSRAYKLTPLANAFLAMVQALQRVQIAHGDLQHGNILIVEGQPRLVDYDGMFVASFANLTSNEIGHRNYQHPLRALHDFDAGLDNFSAWVIYASLRILSLDSTIWQSAPRDGESLLFKQADFQHPHTSQVLRLLEMHECPAIRNLGRRIHANSCLAVADVPPLDADDDRYVEIPEHLPEADSETAHLSFAGDASKWFSAWPEYGKNENGLLFNKPAFAEKDSAAALKLFVGSGTPVTSSAARAADVLPSVSTTSGAAPPAVNFVSPGGGQLVTTAVNQQWWHGADPAALQEAQPAYGLPMQSPTAAASTPSIPTGRAGGHNKGRRAGDSILWNTAVVSSISFALLIGFVTASIQRRAIPPKTQSFDNLLGSVSKFIAVKEKGDAYLQKKQYPYAINAYQTAISYAKGVVDSANTDLASAYLGLGTAYNALKNYDEAQQALYSAIGIYDRAHDEHGFMLAEYEHGINRYYSGDYLDAEMHFIKLERFWESQPDTDERAQWLSKCRGWLQTASDSFENSRLKTNSPPRTSSAPATSANSVATASRSSSSMHMEPSPSPDIASPDNFKH